MTSEVSICNLALGWLGQDPITSLDQKSVPAELCKLNYPELRDTLLASRSWTFATARMKSEATTRDEWGQLFKHPVPPNWIAVQRAYSSLATFSGGDQGSLRMTPPGPQARWSFESGFILSSSSTLYLWGTIRVTDVNQFPPMFTQALAARIAADLAVPLTQNRQLQADMWNLYETKLQDAAVRDGQQGRNELVSGSLLIAARASGGF